MASPHLSKRDAVLAWYCGARRHLHGGAASLRERLSLGDGAHVIYANAACDATGELGKLLSDFLRSDPNEMLDPLMRERVQWLKNTEDGRREMSDVFEQIYEEGRQEGREEGRQETLVESVRNLSRGSGSRRPRRSTFWAFPSPSRRATCRCSSGGAAWDRRARRTGGVR